MSEKNPEIKIYFGFEGQSGGILDLNELTKRLDIVPTETRTLDDWPEAIKHPRVELPDYLRPRCCWTVTLDYEECLAVRFRFEEMMGILRGKEDVINSLRKELHLKTDFTIVIAAHHDRMPEMSFTKENIEFIASIGAEVGFDMYLD